MHQCDQDIHRNAKAGREAGDTLDAGMAVLVLVLPALNYAFYNMQIRKLEQDIERHLSWVEWCMLIIPTLS